MRHDKRQPPVGRTHLARPHLHGRLNTIDLHHSQGAAGGPQLGRSRSDRHRPAQPRVTALRAVRHTVLTLLRTGGGALVTGRRRFPGSLGPCRADAAAHRSPGVPRSDPCTGPGKPWTCWGPGLCMSVRAGSPDAVGGLPLGPAAVPTVHPACPAVTWHAGRPCGDGRLGGSPRAQLAQRRRMVGRHATTVPVAGWEHACAAWPSPHRRRTLWACIGRCGGGLHAGPPAAGRIARQAHASLSG